MSDIFDHLISRIRAEGACAVGVVRAERVDQDAIDAYNTWVESGACGEMAFAKRYRDIREDPRLLLDGCQWVVSCAFSYYTGLHHPFIADYALVRDYHLEVRERLERAASALFDTGTYRICVDSAPIRERYWAAKAGLGFIARNHNLIIPGIGSRVVLGEVLLATDAEPSEIGTPLVEGCPLDCARCVQSCPHLQWEEGKHDFVPCTSYLTIEHRLPLPEGANLHGCAFGCDICQRACPYNASSAPISPFPVNEDILRLTQDDVAAMTSGAWRRLTAYSPLSRIPLKQLRRNLKQAP